MRGGSVSAAGLLQRFNSLIARGKILKENYSLPHNIYYRGSSSWLHNVALPYRREVLISLICKSHSHPRHLRVFKRFYQSRDSRFSIIEEKTKDICKLKCDEHRREEVILLMQLHGDRITGRELTFIMSSYSKALCLQLDDYSAEIFSIALTNKDLTLGQIITAMQLLLAVCDQTESSDAVSELISVFTRKLQPFLSTGLSADDIASCIYTLKNFSTKSDEIKALLECFIKSLSGVSVKSTLTAQSLCMLMYGLQGMKADISVVQRLIEIILHKIDPDNIQLTSQGIAMCFFGMRNMSFESLEVKKLFRMTLKILDRSQIDFNRQSFAMIMCSMWNKYTGSHTSAFIDVILRKITKNNFVVLDKISIIMIFFGMQEMDIELDKVRQFLSYIVGLLKNSSNSLDVDCISKVLASMCWMDSSAPEVIDLVSILNKSLDSKSNIMSDQFNLSSEGVSNVLYGLQRCNTKDSLCMQQLIDILPLIIGSSYYNMSFSDIGKSIFGIRNCLLISPKWKPILSHWLSILFNNLSDMIESSYQSCQHLRLVLFDSNNSFSASLQQHSLLFDFIKIRVLLEEYTSLLESSQSYTTNLRAAFKAKTERLYSLKIQKLIILHYKQLSVRFNEFYCGFECDILLLDKNHVILNIEIDGINHKEIRKKYFCNLRDSHLKARYGTPVLRINCLNPSLANLTGVKVDEFLVSELSTQIDCKYRSK